MTITVMELSAYTKREASGCLRWIGPIDAHGYGVARAESKQIKAHRLAWILVNGIIPEGLFVCHRCDNRWCVEVDHLFLGTAQDNIRDMVAKGRQRSGVYTQPERIPRGKDHWSQRQPQRVTRGESRPNARLTELAVRAIKQALRSGERRADLAATYGVSFGTIYDIDTGRSWRHVEELPE